MLRVCAGPGQAAGAQEADEREAQAPDRPRSPAETVQALQQSAGDRSVARWVTRTRRLDRVEVAEVENDAGRMRRSPSTTLLDQAKAAGTRARCWRVHARHAQAGGQRVPCTRATPFVDEQAPARRIAGRRGHWPPRRGSQGALEDRSAEASSPTRSARHRWASSRGCKGSMPSRPAASDVLATAADRGLENADSLATIDFAHGFTVRGVPVCASAAARTCSRSTPPCTGDPRHVGRSRRRGRPAPQRGRDGAARRRVIEEVGPSSRQPGYWTASDRLRGAAQARRATRRREDGEPRSSCSSSTSPT